MTTKWIICMTMVFLLIGCFSESSSKGSKQVNLPDNQQKIEKEKVPEQAQETVKEKKDLEKKAEKPQGIFLPGTQPKEGKIEFAKAAQCKMCHNRTKNGNADPYFSWEGGMMSQAMRDPIFRSTLTIANQDIAGVGEYCLRCHTPRGWLEGRSTPADTSLLTKEDMHGVSCDVCHRLVDPKAEEAAKFAEKLPPDYGNAMMVADPNNIARGPYGDGTGAMPHTPVKSEFHGQSQICGTCHNVSNPIFAKDVSKQPPHAYGFLERTYSEWLLSDFAKQGKKGTCQACHFPTVEGGGQASRYGKLHRDYFVQHGAIGGSTWVQDAIVYLWQDKAKINAKALETGKKRVRKFLKTSASLKIDLSNQKAKIRITNLTGHKLPTGYIEGRRMWLNIRFFDNSNNIVKEYGQYGNKQDILQGKKVEVPTLLDAEKIKVYESLMAISEKQAKKFGKKPGKSFHFVLNDIVIKDNRIPPKGFNNQRFAEHLSAPIAAKYADGQYWDDQEFAVPTKAVKIQARLMFQSMSWEYLKFLVEENKSDDWGKKLYEAWTHTGQCPPEIIADISQQIK